MDPLAAIQALVASEASASRTLTVTRELTVAQVYPGLPAVFATPQMILLLEQAAADAIAPALPAGWGSVGTLVDVRHLAATPLGMRVTATARVVALDGRVVRFACEARDEHETIGTGWHERAVVELARFVTSVERKQSASRTPGGKP